jgi:hypothetical protein
MTKAQQKASIGTFTGIEFFPFHPNQYDINIRDIAHALSNICRYTGHVNKFWSVAAHSVEVSHRVWRQTKDAKIALTGLMHDASEAYLVDVPRPLKPFFPDYNRNEARLEKVIAKAFDLVYPYPQVVHDVDREMLYDEVANFFSPGSFTRERLNVTEAYPAIRLESFPPEQGEQEFLARFQWLRALSDTDRFDD